MAEGGSLEFNTPPISTESSKEPSIKGKKYFAQIPSRVVNYFISRSVSGRGRLTQPQLPAEESAEMQSQRPTQANTEGPEILPLQPRTYVGLERLDEIKADEDFLANALEHVSDTAKENLSAKISALRVERDELMKKYGLSELLEAEKVKREKETGHEQLEIKDSKSISNVIAQHLAADLPPAQPGYVRMYRGEGSLAETTDDSMGGTWFGRDLTIASGFPIGALTNRRFVYVDIPEESLKDYHVQNMADFKGASKGGEFSLPKETVAQSRELVRFIKADEVNDPWAPSQHLPTAA